MTRAAPMAEITRGDMVESVHAGHAVIARPDGSVVESWGDPDVVLFPRSSMKMIQALPLLESGAGANLTTEQRALACASHWGERQHVTRVARWLTDLGLDEHALCCGPQESREDALAREMIRSGEPVTRLFNNCSGKHTGFLQLAQHFGADLDYVDVDHPVQKAVLAAYEEVTGVESQGFGIDGCSAPNFTTTLRGLARAMADFAAADGKPGVRPAAQVALRDAMRAHPELISGHGAPCAEIIAAASEPLVVKTGAEGVYIAILPAQKLGVALKIADGAGRAAEVAIAALLVRLGALDPAHPVVARYLNRPIRNRMNVVTGYERPATGLLA